MECQCARIQYSPSLSISTTILPHSAPEVRRPRAAGRGLGRVILSDPVVDAIRCKKEAERGRTREAGRTGVQASGQPRRGTDRLLSTPPHTAPLMAKYTRSPPHTRRGAPEEQTNDTKQEKSMEAPPTYGCSTSNRPMSTGMALVQHTMLLTRKSCGGGGGGWKGERTGAQANNPRIR